ncbi:MAG: FAD-binding protein [Micromonosporaceae bacterium]|nr:FAD-binding protein [Micromonosporaceae bacterium]
MTATADRLSYDVIVAGCGAAGMTAALTARRRGLSVLVIEKAEHFGGAAARSPGSLWLPNNEVLRAAGTADSPEGAQEYLAHVAGHGAPAGLRRARLHGGPAMVEFVRRHTPLSFTWSPEHSDCYPDAPGGAPWGRSVGPAPLAAGVLGAEAERLAPAGPHSYPGVPLTQDDSRMVNLVTRHPLGFVRRCEVTVRHAAARLRGQRLLTMGQALAAGLREGLTSAGVPVWLNAALVGLRASGDRVTGVEVLRDGETASLTASRGVVLACGGFEHNARMRQALHRQPTNADWAAGPAENTGDGLLAAVRAGAAVDLMDDAWLAPVIPLAGEPRICRSELATPGSVVVDAAGHRFVNEAAPHVDVGRAMYGPGARSRSGPHTGPAAGPARNLPAWLIIDQRHRDRYPFGALRPRAPFPGAWHTQGVLRRASSLPDLAERIGIPADALCATVDRVNRFAQDGVDADFGRGANAHDRYYGDPRNQPNPCLGRISRPPFYAVRLVPGDFGVTGGLRIDAHARVLREDGTPIGGLYAAGDVATSPTGRAYPGPGAVLGSAMTFGHLAALHLAAQEERSRDPVVT